MATTQRHPCAPPYGPVITPYGGGLPLRKKDPPTNVDPCRYLGKPTGEGLVVKCGEPEATPSYFCLCPSRRRTSCRRPGERPGWCTPFSVCREPIQWCGICQDHKPAPSAMHQAV